MACKTDRIQRFHPIQTGTGFGSKTQTGRFHVALHSRPLGNGATEQKAQEKIQKKKVIAPDSSIDKFLASVDALKHDVEELDQIQKSKPKKPQIKKPILPEEPEDEVTPEEPEELEPEIEEIPEEPEKLPKNLKVNKKTLL